MLNVYFNSVCLIYVENWCFLVDLVYIIVLVYLFINFVYMRDCEDKKYQLYGSMNFIDFFGKKVFYFFLIENNVIRYRKFKNKNFYN